MKATGVAYAAGTVINALSLGVGSAFALNLKTITEVEKSKETVLVSDGLKSKSQIVETALEYLGIKEGVTVKVKSSIPKSSGLGSSSAFVNSLLLALSKLFDLDFDPIEIVKINAKISLDCGISYTGAMDDAAASLLGGFVVTDNKKLELLRHDKINSRAAILIPPWNRKKIDVDKMRHGETEIIKSAIDLALEGMYCEAMKLNSDYCCAILGYDTTPVRLAEKSNLCAGLSGNGPAYVAFGSSVDICRLLGEWTKFGKVILTTIPSDPAFKHLNS